MYRHKILQKHEPSGRMNLYIATHAHHIDGVSQEKSDELLNTLIEHCTQPKYTLKVPWHAPGDMVLWDNTCTMHKATGGEFEGKYARDMRRTTVHDGSSTAWGLNRPGEGWQGFSATGT